MLPSKWYSNSGLWCWPAIRGWNSRCQMLGAVSPEVDRTPLPNPYAHLVAKAHTVLPLGEKQASFKSISFDVKPGEAVGVAGPSGAGKNACTRTKGTMAPCRWINPPRCGSLASYGPAILGQLIGYLPRRVQLFDGTIAENIARLDPKPPLPRWQRRRKLLQRMR